VKSSVDASPCEKSVDTFKPRKVRKKLQQALDGYALGYNGEARALSLEARYYLEGAAGRLC
jgi:hypothetical protein